MAWLFNFEQYHTSINRMKMNNVTHTFKSIIILSGTLFLAGIFSNGTLKAQSSVYDNFENSKFVHYHEKGGVLDTNAKNPSVGGINPSAKCGMYVRNGAKKFD